MKNFQEKVGFIWSVADLLRGDYRQSEYGKVILPLTVLRRVDCVLEPTKDKVLERAKSLPAKADEKMKELMLCQAAGSGMTFYNTSRFVFQPTEAAKGKKYVSLLSDQEQIAANLNNFIAGFSANAREIFIDKFKLGDQINRLDEANLIYLVLSKFTEIDLHPDVVDNIEMGYIFEELIRRFSEASNETAGEHFTPREVIRLMVNLLFADDSEALTKKGVIRTLYDPAAGTGGMLSVGENHLRELNPSATLKVFGQELNPESYAICKSDMLIKGEDATHVKFGNSFTQDGLPGEKFDYFLSNPPFGVEWKKVEKEIRDENEKLGMAGRFGAGLPRVGDGSLLFLQHMVSKFRQDGTGSRLAIVFNGSPLFTGSAGSGESEIRRWIIENDWLEAIVGMPDQLFYNTGIATYVWVVTNRKPRNRKGKVQLIDATSFFVKMRKSLGNKRNEIGDGVNGKPDQIGEITRIYGDFEEGEYSKIFDNEDFGNCRITVERPLRLNFVVDAERLTRLGESSGFTGLAENRKKGSAGQKEVEEGKKLQNAVLKTLDALRGKPMVKNREEFIGILRESFKRHHIDLKAPLLKMLLAALSDRDETADICTDAKGNPEPDTELRDYENVPLKNDIKDYFRREVLPHIPDAWIDEDKTKKGYEIPFTRYFYKYTPLRHLDEIEAEITALEEEIQGMLREVMS
jgi:type I restriction enzyme M protein